MDNRWTPERRARQAQAIRSWRPWEKSTGPRSAQGKAVASCNGYKGGHRPMFRQMAALLRQQRDALAEWV